MLDVRSSHRGLDLPGRRVVPLDPNTARVDQLPRVDEAGLERLDLLQVERQLAMKVRPFGQVIADQASGAQNPEGGGDRVTVNAQCAAMASGSIRESHFNEA